MPPGKAGSNHFGMSDVVKGAWLAEPLTKFEGLESMETFTRRRVRTAAAGTLLAAAALLLSACNSSSSSAAAEGPASSAAASATASASGPASAPPSTGTVSSPTAVSSASAAAPGGAAIQSAADTFLAAGQDVKGTALFKPACVHTYGCALSGDSTAFLYKMTWTTWSASEAIGTGTYKIDGCNPNCAAGTVYPVPAVITLTDPVRVCSAAGTRWFWSHAAFNFPNGLPKALQGSNAPQNPWTFSSVAAAAGQGCTSS
jgi:hypothetical protein